MSTMFRRLLLLTFLVTASFALAQNAPLPDAPTPQPDAGQSKSAAQPAAETPSKPAASKPASRNTSPNVDDPSSPDWSPDPDKLYEKKSMGQRMKDTITTPPCISIGGGPCRQPSTGAKSKKKTDDSAQGPGPNQKPPRMDDDERDRSLNADGESTSRSTIGDISPPKNDAANHPNSSADPADDVAEAHLWDPHKAAKDIEVGDYYFKRKNYRAAASRYEEALVYKDNFAEAMYKLALANEKLNQADQARFNYERYLKTLPNGEFAEDARQALARLDAPTTPPKQ